jgi:hypothetical protein
VHMDSALDTNMDADEDLRDVFRLMYDDEEDWADFDEVRDVFEWMVTVTVADQVRTNIHLSILWFQS